ncbi:MAG: NAD(P)/FAD-dependent oxidoreductase [Bacilli bacterium]|nr:NAD(P)/FAD-dependent oxidoreductase [Bacilli bacterium]
MEKIFDVIVIGAGVIGCSVARYLSRYKGSFLVLEKHNDVGEETSSANSAIVHSGYDPKPGTKKAIFNVKGNKMMPQVAEELDVPFIMNGSLTVSFSDEEDETLDELLERAKENGVEARIVEYEELMKMEPNLNPEAHKAILCPTAGIISPFNLCVNYMENAMDNGVELKLNTLVKKIERNGDIYTVICDNGETFKSKTLVNAAGLYSDEIASQLDEIDYHVIPRKGEYFVLDHFDKEWVKHTLFMCPTKVGKGVLVSPTSSFDYIVGPTNEDAAKTDTSTEAGILSELKVTAAKLVPNIPYFENIRQFSGVRANSSIGDFVIEESKNNPGLFNLACIMSPGLASSPAIGEYVADLVRDKLNLENNSTFNPRIRKHIRFTKLTNEEYNKIVKENPKYGKVICRCETVTEGEIIDAIRRNCGARTVKGIKKRLRPGFGKCQGTFCQNDIIKILAREQGVEPTEINYSDLGTQIMKYDVKGGN